MAEVSYQKITKYLRASIFHFFKFETVLGNIYKFALAIFCFAFSFCNVGQKDIAEIHIQNSPVWAEVDSFGYSSTRDTLFSDDEYFLVTGSLGVLKCNKKRADKICNLKGGWEGWEIYQFYNFFL